MTTTPAVEAIDLVKHFGETRAVDGVSFVGSRGHGPRPARAQRRGQDHVGPHADHA